jgi:NADH dehydrogenase/NADH:ubiquinone oxidoreductase subunit G
MFTFTIDGREVGAEKGETIIEAARRAGVKIPTLCYHETISSLGACRLCSVEVKDGPKTRVVQSCIYKAKPGISVKTKSETVIELRKKMLSKILGSNITDEEIDEISKRDSLEDVNFPIGDRVCRVCGICVRACKEISEAGVLTFEGKGEDKRVVPSKEDVSDICIGCGACAYLCPTGNIRIENNYVTLSGRKLAMLNEFQKKEKAKV